jgi:preprotein translocase subunit SecE
VLTLNFVALNKITTYLKEVYVELLHKTSWPSFKELQKESLIVLVASVVFSLLIMLMDGAFKKVMDLIYNL